MFLELRIVAAGDDRHLDDADEAAQEGRHLVVQRRLAQCERAVQVEDDQALQGSSLKDCFTRYSLQRIARAEVRPLGQELVAVGIAPVAGHAEIVERLRRGIGRGEARQHVDVARLGLVEALQSQVRHAESAQRPRHELGRRQKAVPPIELGAVVVQDANVRRPDVMDAVQKLVVLGLRIVELHRHAVRDDRVGDGGLRIRHGIQRLASPSTRVEHVEEDELALCMRALERRLVVGCPGNLCHGHASGSSEARRFAGPDDKLPPT